MRGAVVGAGVGGSQTAADTDGTAPAAALAQRQWAGLAALAALGISDHPASGVSDHPAWVPDRERGDYDHRSEGTPALLRHRLAYGLLLAVGVFLAARFAVFWFHPARLPRDFGARLNLADIFLFAALTFVVWHRQLLDLCAWLACARMEAYRPAPPPVPGLRVA